MYLLTIKKISNSKHVIRSVDVASQMEYSRASIHKMLGTLKKLKLIDQEYYGSIKLTSLGSRVANAYQKKYDTIVSALQGTVTALSAFIKPIMTEEALLNLSTVGSILIFCVGINRVWGKKIRVANLLPAIVFAVAAAFLPFEL